MFSIFFAIFCNSRKALKSYVLFQNFILLDFYNFQDFPRFSDFLNVFQILKDFFNSQSIWRINSFKIFQSFRHLDFKSFSSFIFPSFTFLYFFYIFKLLRINSNFFFDFSLSFLCLFCLKMFFQSPSFDRYIKLNVFRFLNTLRI